MKTPEKGFSPKIKRQSLKMKCLSSSCLKWGPLRPEGQQVLGSERRMGCGRWWSREDRTHHGAGAQAVDGCLLSQAPNIAALRRS